MATSILNKLFLCLMDNTYGSGSYSLHMFFLIKQP